MVFNGEDLQGFRSYASQIKVNGNAKQWPTLIFCGISKESVKRE